MIFQTVLAQTQDKALKRIEKLREEKKTLSEKLAKAQNGAADSEVDYSFRFLSLA